MNKIPRFMILFLILLGAISLSACTINIDRQTDGSLRMEVVMTQAQITQEIKQGIADPTVKDLTVELKNGYIQVTGSRLKIASSDNESLTFRLDLRTVGGKLTAEVSQAQVNGYPLDEKFVKQWNERIARNLERAAFRSPNSSLQTVTISPESIKLIYRIETVRSKSR